MDLDLAFKPSNPTLFAVLDVQFSVLSNEDSWVISPVAAWEHSSLSRSNLIAYIFLGKICNSSLQMNMPINSCLQQKWTLWFWLLTQNFWEVSITYLSTWNYNTILLNTMSLLDDIGDQKWIFTRKNLGVFFFWIKYTIHCWEDIVVMVGDKTFPYCKASKVTYTGKHRHFSSLMFLGITVLLQQMRQFYCSFSCFLKCSQHQYVKHS